MKNVDIPVAEIYVPADRRKPLEADKVDAMAEDILENGQKMPIQVRLGKDRYVLIEGLHRLEAVKALGEETIVAIVVAARRH